MWNREYFEFNLNSQATLVLNANCNVRENEIAQKELDLTAKEEHDRAERKRIDAQRNADRIEASRRRREEEDLRVKKAEDEARLRRVFKCNC